MANTVMTRKGPKISSWDFMKQWSANLQPVSTVAPLTAVHVLTLAERVTEVAEPMSFFQKYPNKQTQESHSTAVNFKQKTLEIIHPESGTPNPLSTNNMEQRQTGRKKVIKPWDFIKTWNLGQSCDSMDRENIVPIPTGAPIIIDVARQERSDKKANSVKVTGREKVKHVNTKEGKTASLLDESASREIEVIAAHTLLRNTLSQKLTEARVVQETEEAKKAVAKALDIVERKAWEDRAALEVEEARRLLSSSMERERLGAERAALVAQAILDEAEKVHREEERKVKDAAKIATLRIDQSRDVTLFDTSNPRRAAEALFARRSGPGSADEVSIAIPLAPADPRAEAERFFSFSATPPSIATLSSKGGDMVLPAADSVSASPMVEKAAEPAPFITVADSMHEPSQHHLSRRQKPERERVDIHGRGGIRRTVEVVKVRGGLLVDVRPRTKLTLRGPVPMDATGSYVSQEKGAETTNQPRHTAMTLFAPKVVALTVVDPGKNAFTMIRKLIRNKVDHGLILKVVRLVAVASKIDEMPNLAVRVRQLIDDAMTSLTHIEGMLSPAGNMETEKMTAAD